jgi:cysteine-rich repeat protein
MRKCAALALLVTFSWIEGLAQDARAGVTVDVVFQDGTGRALTIDKRDEGPGCAFGGYQGGSVSTGYCMDVIVRSTYDFVGLGMLVGYESDHGLAIGSAYEWWGPILGWSRGAPNYWCRPPGGLQYVESTIRYFDCVVLPQYAPPQVAAGTYRVGTIVWDTSRTIPGTDTIAALIDDAASGLNAVINGNVVYLHSADITQNSATLYISGEAPMCGDGLVDGSEECDDGWLTPGDGCDSSCQVEPGWLLTSRRAASTPRPHGSPLPRRPSPGPRRCRPGGAR